MDAHRSHLPRWLPALFGLCIGLAGCSQPQTQTVRHQADPSSRDGSIPGQPEAAERIRRVQEAPAASGDTYAVWVEKTVASEGGRYLFGDWSSGTNTVRFTYAIRDDDYRITTRALEWKLGNDPPSIAPPQRRTLASRAHKP